ncbi:DeoR/GlpR family DNA-binding transcription regulator [Rossellomorea aquimaris]|uniref:DeoR/GlpR family DNA-binding transcription regulator n=1 Tax=Rossellomorea aquimaris TaxID=189382 RepID=UPI0007D0651E|nr:DeoR/GlpR family DNA-binding transcription regulator [Rossellomorea aquimaris]
MFSEERRELIYEKIEKLGRILAKDLAEEFNVSIDSIRRDLSIMEEEGLIKRTHGGAISQPNVRQKPQHHLTRYGDSNEYQNAIARKAIDFIQEGNTIFIGGAAIHFAMLKYLPKLISYTVVTNSLEIAYHLRDMMNIDTYLIGGKVKESGNITDALANDFIKQFTLDLSFITAGGISPKGLSTTSPEVALFHKTIIENSTKVIALMEHTKIGEDLFIKMHSLSKLDLLITDREDSEEKLELIRSSEVKTIYAYEDD